MNNIATKTNWKRLESLTDDEIDTSDIPELDETFFKNAQLREVEKQTLTLKLDTDIVDWLKHQKQGYQTQINQLLRHYMQSQQH